MALLSVIVVFGFIGATITAVQVYVIPSGRYDSTGPYDTLQCANASGQVQAFGGSPNPYYSKTNITVYDTAMPTKTGSCVDTLNVNLFVSSGTVQGYSASCLQSAYLDGSLLATIPCRSGTVTGVVGSTVSLAQLTVTGSALYAKMVGSYLNKSGTLAFYASGSLTVNFLQGCASPPCGVTKSFNSTLLSASTVFLTTSGTVVVKAVSGGSQFVHTTTTQGQPAPQAGFGLRFCSPSSGGGC